MKIDFTKFKSGQSACPLRLRLRVRFSVRTFTVLLQPSRASTHVKRISQHSAESRGFSPGAQVSSHKEVDRVGYRINTDKEVRSQLL